MSRLVALSSLVGVFVVALAVQPFAVPQTRRPVPPQPTRESLDARSNDMERAGMAEPFKGITTNGTLEAGLFPIRSTGVSTKPVKQAVETFLSALTPAQRSKTTFGVDDPEWHRWMNQDFYIRQGVSFLEMSDAQREAAFGVLRASLSAKGLRQTRDIMRLNQTLGELNDNNFDRYGEWRYHIAVMGTPSDSEPWGWQLDGHHAVINYFVMGDQIVMTPFFAGSEPTIARSGRHAGTSVLQDEEQAGLAMINALDPAQRSKAILRVSKTGNENLAEAWKDNIVLDDAGVPARELTAAQQAQLVDLISLYVANMDDGHARVKMEDVRAQLDRTWFAWIGKTEPGSVFYYRIHSPVILIEFDHQLPIAITHLLDDPKVPTIEHIHTVVRTPNGNDYGKDLLRQHYAQHPHPASAAR